MGTRALGEWARNVHGTSGCYVIGAAVLPRTTISKQGSRNMKTISSLVSVVLLLALAIPLAAKEAHFAFRGIWADASSFATQQSADKLLDQCPPEIRSPREMLASYEEES